MRRFITCLLTAFCFFLFGASAAKAEQVSGPWSYELTSEGLVIRGFAGSDADVVIPDEIEGNKVSIIGQSAFKDNHTIKTLVIPEGVTRIQSEAFLGCTGLSLIEFNAKNCTVPDIWIYDDSRGCGVFSGAGSSSPTGLKVVFGDGVARVPDHLFDTASLDEYGFNGYPYACVTEVEFSDGVKEIGACAFRSCQLLESVTFGAGLKLIDTQAFWGCTHLPALAFPDKLTSIGEGAFARNEALETIAFGAGLESIGVSAFSGCVSLEALDMVSPLTTIDRKAFADCTALKTMTLPETLVNLNAEAFYGCVHLSAIDFNCANLTVPDIWIYDDSKGVGVFSGAGSASATGLTVTFGDKMTAIPDHLFDTASLEEYGKNGYAYAFVTDVVFSDSVKTIGSCAFRSCQSLKSVTFGSSVKSIGPLAFWDCRALESLAFDDALLEIGDEAFRYDTALESITWGTGLETIGASAFGGCTSLAEVSFVNPLTTVGPRAFMDCTGLTSLYLPENVTTLGAEAFMNCSKLAEITFDCPNVTIPEVWIYDDNKGAGVFSGAGSASTSGLTVHFGEKVTKVPDRLFETASDEEYGHNGYAYAFVTEAEIPASVTEVGLRAFYNCQNLETVRFLGMDAMLAEGVFDGCTARNFHVECPAGGFTEYFITSAGIPCTILEAEAPAPQGSQADGAEQVQPAGAESAQPSGNTTVAEEHKCSNCGYVFPEGMEFKFCPQCATPVE